MRKTRLATALGATALAAVASPQFLLVPNSSSDTIVKHSAFDGSVIGTFITDANDPNTYDFTTPKAVIQVGNEVWVSDQVADSVFRFDMNGNYLSKITGGMDNIRGLNVVNGEVWVANSGTLNGAPGDAIIRYTTSGALIGSFAVGDPFDVIQNGGEALVVNIATDDIDRYSFAGAFLGTFHNSDGISGIDFPEQIAADGGNWLVAGFSAPAGIYQYDGSGVQINYWAPRSLLSGVRRLENGNIMYTVGGGAYTFNPATGSDVLIGGGNQFIGYVVPEPATLAVLGLGALALLRRRKRS